MPADPPPPTPEEIAAAYKADLVEKAAAVDTAHTALWTDVDDLPVFYTVGPEPLEKQS